MSGHGVNRYTNDACRCDVCREAMRVYQAKRRAQRRAWVDANGLPPSVAHGANGYQNWGCRCDVCRRGHAEAQRRRRATA